MWESEEALGRVLCKRSKSDWSKWTKSMNWYFFMQLRLETKGAKFCGPPKKSSDDHWLKKTSLRVTKINWVKWQK